MITEIKEEAEKMKAVVSVIPENYLTENSTRKSKILYKNDSLNGHKFVEIVCDTFLERDVEIVNEILFDKLKRSWSDNYDNINEFMNSLHNLKSKHHWNYVIVTKTSTYGNTQVRNFVTRNTPNYQLTKAYTFGYLVHIESLIDIWNNFKVDFKAIYEAKKREEKIRYDFGQVKEVKRQIKIRNDRIEKYKEDLEFFFFNRNSLEVEIQNQTLRVVKTVRPEPSETEHRFHRVLNIIEKLHPKSQSNIKSSEWSTSGESYEIREWKKEIKVTREQVYNHLYYLTEVYDFKGSQEERQQYLIKNKISFRDLTISLLDLDEANHYILDLVSQVADMIEDIVLIPLGRKLKSN